MYEIVKITEEAPSLVAAPVVTVVDAGAVTVPLVSAGQVRVRFTVGQSILEQDVPFGDTQAGFDASCEAIQKRFSEDLAANPTPVTPDYIANG